MPGTGFSVQHVEECGIEVRPQDGIAALERTAKRGLCLIELPSHAHVLRALAGEQKGDFRTLAPCGMTTDTATRRLPLDDSSQLFGQLLRRGTSQGQAVVKMGPAGMRREADVLKAMSGCAARLVA